VNVSTTLAGRPPHGSVPGLLITCAVRLIESSLLPVCIRGVLIIFNLALLPLCNTLISLVSLLHPDALQ
jgi:hypothetical protein